MYPIGTHLKISAFGWEQRYDTQLTFIVDDVKGRVDLDMRPDDVWVVEKIVYTNQVNCRNLRTGEMQAILDIDCPGLAVASIPRQVG